MSLINEATVRILILILFNAFCTHTFLWLHRNVESVHLIFIYSISHFYSLTLLFNLNIRKRLRRTPQTWRAVVMPDLESHINASELQGPASEAGDFGQGGAESNV
jgi:hypothetical protein